MYLGSRCYGMLPKSPFFRTKSTHFSHCQARWQLITFSWVSETCPRACLPSWWKDSPHPKPGSMWQHEGSVSSQHRTTWKGHPSSRASYGISWGLLVFCWNHCKVHFPLPSPAFLTPCKYWSREHPSINCAPRPPLHTHTGLHLSGLPGDMRCPHNSFLLHVARIRV